MQLLMDMSRAKNRGGLHMGEAPKKPEKEPARWLDLVYYVKPPHSLVVPLSSAARKSNCIQNGLPNKLQEVS